MSTPYEDFIAEAIQQAAYDIWTSGKNGDALTDWLEAEAAVRKRFRYIYAPDRRNADEQPGEL